MSSLTQWTVFLQMTYSIWFYSHVCWFSTIWCNYFVCMMRMYARDREKISVLWYIKLWKRILYICEDSLSLFLTFYDSAGLSLNELYPNSFEIIVLYCNLAFSEVSLNARISPSMRKSGFRIASFTSTSSVLITPRCPRFPQLLSRSLREKETNFGRLTPLKDGSWIGMEKCQVYCFVKRGGWENGKSSFA